MVITIYDRAGNPRTELAANDSSTQMKAIQGDNVLTLSFTLYEKVELDVYDYVDYEDERYWLTEQYRPKQKSTKEWVYDMKFYGIESLLRNLLVIKTVDNENDPVFTLTAPPREHVAMIVKCMNDGLCNITDWKVGQVDGTGNIVIDYHGKYCDEALREIAEKVEAEYWIDGQTINVCRCEHGEPITLGYNKGLRSIDPGKADNVKFYTRLWPVGSSRNIDPEKYGYSRLQLPDGQKYVEVNADRYGRVDHYEADAFADIYPRRTGTISSVRSEVKKGEDGKDFTIWYFRDDSLPFNPNDYEIGGLVKRISFQEGSELAGLGSEEDGTYYFEVNYNATSREFEIITIWPYDNDMQLPGGSLVPKAGDKYILWNLRMPDEYYGLAEEEFMTAVNKYNADHALDISVFKAPTDHEWIKEHKADLFIGRRVRLESPHYFPGTGYRDSRITKITRKVNLPSQMDIEIGDALSRTSKEKINDDISAVKSFARSIGESISLPDIVRVGDSTKLTDNNLLSALRTIHEIVSRSLSRQHDDTAKGLVTFLKGLVSQEVVKTTKAFQAGNYEPGASGGIFGMDAEGDSFAEVARLYVRVRAFFEELTIIKAGVLAGKQYITPGGGVKCTGVEETPGAWRCWFLSEQDGDRTKCGFEVGDQATARVFNAREGTSGKVSNRRYWRLVTAVVNDARADNNGNHYGYIDLSKIDCEAGSDVPVAGDEICQLGSRSDVTRQAAMVFSTVDADAPSMKLFSGINSFSLAGKAVVAFGRDAVTGKVFFRLGASGARQFLEYTQDGGLRVAGRISAESTYDDGSGNDRTLGEVIVSNTETLYISHTSPSQQDAPSLPTLDPNGLIADARGWAATAPEWQEGRYIWQTTYVRRGDGSASFSDPTCIQGANGKSVSVTSTEVRYSTVHTATQPADPTFTLADVPSLAAGQYLWSRTRVGYDNGDSTTTYAVSRLGENGADGTAWGNGKMLFNDPTFKKGSNKVFPYSHPSPGTLTVTRIDDAAAPNDSGKVMRIRSIGELKPGLGGFYQVTQARASATFIQRFVARIPVGYTLAFGYNNIGTPANGAKVEWLTPNAGTGKWEEYMLKFRIADIPDNGSQTVFGTFGHIYLTGPVYGTEEAPVDWYLAYATTFDMDANGEFLIESQSVTYAKTTVATQPADSAFIYTSLGAAGVGPGDYLWCKTEVKYSDGTVVKSYSVSRIGSDGEQGTPGPAGADGRTPYVHHAYANSADGTAGFSTTYFKGALYVGVCTDYNLPDPTTPSSYEWARLKGEDGISAKTVTVNSDARVFTYENDFASLTGPSKITLTASVQGIGNPVYHWSYKQAGQTAFTELGDRTPTIELTPAGAVIGQSRSVTVRCTVDGVYDEVTIIKVSSGANAAPARSVRIAGEQVFTYEDDFATLVGPGSITLAATLQGTGGYRWQYKAAGASAWTDFTPGSNPTVLITPSDSSLFPAGARSVIVRCTSEDVYDEFTVYKVSSGSRGERGESGGSYSPNLLTGTKLLPATWNSDYNGTNTRTTVINAEGFREFTQKRTATGQTNAHAWVGTMLDGRLPGDVFLPGRTYTLSFDYKSTGTIRASLDIRNSDNSGVVYVAPTTRLPKSEQWRRGHITAIMPEYTGSRTSALLQLTLDYNSSTDSVGETATFRKVCVTEGTSTEWVPSASEMVGTDAYTVILTNESHTFEGDTEKALPASTDCGVLVFKGNQRVAATIGSITGAPAGMSVSGIVQPTATAPGAFKVNVTGTLTQRQGTLTVPVTVDGTRFDRVFSWSLSLQGTDGASYTENLLCETGKTVENSNYLIAKYDLAEAPAVGEQMTITIWGELATTKNAFVAYNSGGNVPLATLQKVSEGVYQGQFTWKNAAGATSRYVNIYTLNSEQSGVSRIDRIKLERGHNSAPVWTPAPTDSDAYSIILTNESHIFEGDTEKAVSGSASSEIIAYKGATQVAATIGSISGMPAGMSVSKTGDGTVNAGFTVSVTPVMKTRQGVLTVPVTVDGKQFIRKFSWSLSLRGTPGTPGTSVLAQYSADGSNWHPTFTTGDLWMRTSADGGKTWSDGMRFTGPGYAPNLLAGTDPDTWKDISVSQYEGTVIGLYKTLESVGLAPGDTMTVSVDVKSLSAKGLRVYVAINDAGSTRLGNFYGNNIAAGTRGRSSVTITIPQNAAKFGIYISNANLTTVTETTTEKYRALKVCKGTDATWSPAASEMVGTDGKWRKFQWAKGTDTVNEPTSGWSDTPMTAPPGEYVWMRSGLVVPPATVPAKWDKAVRLTGDTGAAGSDVYRLDIDNEVAAVACNAAGTPISYPPPANASVYKGGTRLTSGVSYSIPQTSGIFADISDKGAITLRGMEADTAEITVQARVGGVTLTTIMSVYKVRPGADGSPAVIYKLMTSVNNITIDANGHLSTNAVSCKVYKTTGANTPVLTGERQLKYQRIGIDSYEHPVTLTNGTSPAIAVTEEVEAVVFTLYDGSTMLDRERIFVIADARGLAIGGENLLRNSDFIDGSLHWRTYPADSGCVDFNAGAAYDHLGRKSAHFHISGAQQNTFASVHQYIQGFVPGELHTFSGYIYVNEPPAAGEWLRLLVQVTDDLGRHEHIVADQSTLIEGNWVFFSGKVPVSTTATLVRVMAQVQRNATFHINSWKFERGNIATAWSASSKDTGYLRQALGQDTDVAGGVILSSLIQARDVDGNVTAGVNGIANSGRSIAIWGGGPLRDAAYENDGAAFALRHDGSVYAAHNTVRFEEKRMEVGDNLRLDHEGLTMFGSDGQTHLRIADTPVSDYLLSAASINPVSVSKPLATTLVKHTTAQGAVSTAWTFGLIVPNSLELKELQKGMRIELVVKAEITSAAPAQPLTGNLVAAVVDDTTNTAITTVTAPVRGTAASATSTAIVNTTVPAAGTYRVEWWLAGDGKGGGEVLVPTVRTTVKGRTATGYTDLVVIGNNGLLAKFGLTRFCVRERGITMETGDFIFEVSETYGIRYKGRSGNWKELT